MDEEIKWPSAYILKHYWQDRDTFWARKQFDIIIEKGDASAVQAIEELARAIPNDEGRMDLAGHFMDLVKQIIVQERSLEAAVVLDSEYLYELWTPWPQNILNKLQALSEKKDNPSIGENVKKAFWDHRRTQWAETKIDDMTRAANNRSIQVLESLAPTAPDELSRAILAAGPLESIVQELVEDNDNPQLANFILKSPNLAPLLASVWPESALDELRSLANTTNMEMGEIHKEDLPIKLVEDYWMHYKTMWADGRIRELTALCSLSSVSALEALAKIAPDQQMLVSFTKELLNNLVERIIDQPKGKTQIAQSILLSPVLNPLLKHMWPEANNDKLRQIADK
jgi:hypothetical protein